MGISRKRQPELSIVTPVYNEAGNFPTLYKEIKSKISVPHKIIVVYDFDEDTTVPIVKKFQKSDKKLSLVKNKKGKGALNAILSGFESVRTGPLLVTMADLSDDLGVVDDMYSAYLDGADIVAGCRYMRGGGEIGGPLVKRMLSRFAGASLRWIRGIPTSDVTNNFKLYNKDFLNEIEIESRGGFEIGMEITIKAFRLRRKIVEIPSTWRDRTDGESNFKLMKWLPSYIKWYFFAFGPRRR